MKTLNNEIDKKVKKLFKIDYDDSFVFVCKLSTMVYSELFDEFSFIHNTLDRMIFSYNN